MMTSDLWPVCSRQSWAFIDSDRESAHTSSHPPWRKSENWPRISICDHVGPCSQRGCQGGGSECDDYLTDRKPFCLRGYLAACRGDDVSAGGQKGHFTVQLLLVSCRCSRNQIKTYPKWHSPPSLHRIIMSCYCDVQPRAQSSDEKIKVLLTWNW